MGSQQDYIAMDGKSEGEKLAEAQYPYLVERENTAILAKARGIIKKKMDEARGKPYAHNIYSLSDIHPSVQEQYRELYENLYSNAYAKGYYDKLAKLDKEAGITPTMPTATSPTGATITVTSVDRSNPNAYVYNVQLIDPGYIDGVFQPEPLTVVFEPEAPTASDTTTSTSSSASRVRIGGFSIGQASSFSDTTRASAGSDAIPSRTPQGGRKPTRSHWGK